MGAAVAPHQGVEDWVQISVEMQDQQLHDVLLALRWLSGCARLTAAGAALGEKKVESPGSFFYSWALIMGADVRQTFEARHISASGEAC